MENPFVSIVIPTYNRKGLLVNCLSSFSNQAYPADKFEVIVVDDGSTDGTEAEVIDLIKNVPFTCFYIRQENQGVTGARNTGIKTARGDVIGFTSDDVTVDSMWIESAARHFKDMKTGGVEGIIVATEKDMITPFTHHTESLQPRRFLGANMFYRKSALLDIGGYDERFNLHIREDSDIAFSVLEKGWKIVFDREAIVQHPTYLSKHWGLFKEAKNGYVEPLLYCKHKDLMRKHKKFKIDRRTIIAIPYYYYGYYLSVLLALLAASAQFSYFYAIVLFCFSHFITVYARARRKRVSINDMFILACVYTVIPFGRLYYVLKGCIRFRSLVFL